jgi:hypothetical protein
MSDQADELFFKARNITDPAERHAFLEKPYGDVPELLAKVKALTPHEHKKPLQNGEWELIKQHGKRTTVKVTSRGLSGIRHSTEFTVTVLDSDTLQMEDARMKDKPFIFKRAQAALD